MRMSTKKERLEAMKRKYPSIQEKIAAIVAVAVVFVLLGYGIYYSIVLGLDPFLIAIMIIVFVFMIPISVFLLEHLFYRGGG